MDNSLKSDIDLVTFGPTRLPLAHLEFFNIDSGTDSRKVMLAVFRSELGSVLQSREPKDAEIEDIRSTCSLLVNLAAKTKQGVPDDYFIELAHGDEANYVEIPPSRRVVFGLEHTSWSEEIPSRIQVS